MSSLILHIPHSSTCIPPEYRGEFALTDVELAQELLNMTDAFTDELFPKSRKSFFAMFPVEYPRVVFPVSRLVCDPERFRDDALEPMSERGMGAIYICGSQGQPIRTPKDREATLCKYYDPHHARLTELVRKTLDEHNECLILDCHSFSPTPLPYEPDQGPERPDICIGADESNFHTPLWLVEKVKEYLEWNGYTVAINRPYAGTIVPMEYYQKDSRVSSLMIEINRGLYMNEDGTKNNYFSCLQQDLDGLFALLTGYED